MPQNAHRRLSHALMAQAQGRADLAERCARQMQTTEQVVVSRSFVLGLALQLDDALRSVPGF